MTLGSEAPGCAIARDLGLTMTGPTCSCQTSGAGLPVAGQVGGSPANHRALATGPVSVTPSLRYHRRCLLSTPGRLPAAAGCVARRLHILIALAAGSLAHCHRPCVLSLVLVQLLRPGLTFACRVPSFNALRPVLLRHSSRTNSGTFSWP